MILCYVSVSVVKPACNAFAFVCIYLQVEAFLVVR